MKRPVIENAKRTRRILKGLPRTTFYDLVWDYLERIEQKLEKIQRDTRRIARRSK